MVPTAEKERVKALIRDTLTLLCRNGLPFSDKFTIEALIGITIDESDVVLMSMNELVKADVQKSKDESTSNEAGTQRQSARKRSSKRNSPGERSKVLLSQSYDKAPYEPVEDDTNSVPPSPLKEDTNYEEPNPKRVKSEHSEFSPTFATNDEAGDGFEAASDGLQENDDEAVFNDDNSKTEQSDIIIKEEVDDDVEWISSNFGTEAPEPTDMTGENPGGSFQNQPFPLQMSFPQRTATVTGANSGPSPTEQEQILAEYISNSGSGDLQSLRVVELPATDVKAEFACNKMSDHDSTTNQFPNLPHQSNMVVVHHPSSLSSPGSNVPANDMLLTTPRTRKTTYCSICDHHFSSSSKLTRHLKEVHCSQKETFLCPVDSCRSAYMRRDQVKRHLTFKHNIEDETMLTTLLRDVISAITPR